MSKSVYVVTTGAYSDYHVVAIFKSEEKAKAYCEAVGYDDYYGYCNYSRFELADDSVMFNEAIAEAANRKDPVYEVEFYTLSRIDWYDCKKLDDYDLIPPDVESYGNGYYVVYVIANDPDDAVKKAKDRLAAYRANEEGI